MSGGGGIRRTYCKIMLVVTVWIQEEERNGIEVFKNVPKDSFGHIPNLFANKARFVSRFHLLVCLLNKKGRHKHWREIQTMWEQAMKRLNYKKYMKTCNELQIEFWAVKGRIIKVNNASRPKRRNHFFTHPIIEFQKGGGGQGTCRSRPR